jgi:hypothetical protein
MPIVFGLPLSITAVSEPFGIFTRLGARLEYGSGGVMERCHPKHCQLIVSARSAFIVDEY